MQVLFLHNNFPAQFGSFGQFLAAQGWDVWFGTQKKNCRLKGLKVFNYEPHRKINDQTHPYAANFENAALNGQAVVRAALKLKAKGLKPDIVVAHSGWGPGLFVKDLWPDAKFVGYFEWYYWPNSPDVAFFGKSDRSLDDQLRSRTRNAAILMDLASCDAGLCPTVFQYDQFPDCVKSKLHVIHDGIDTEFYRPNHACQLKLNGADLSDVKEIITYVARGMEPYRGFPQFMKAMEIVLERRANAHAVIVGEDRVAYGKKLDSGDSYKKQALKTLALDMDRVHFAGLLPRNRYLEALQASSVHMYFTAPFVLSWSMMEAMSAECAIVASDCAPVRELIDHNGQGALVDMNDAGAVADAVIDLLQNEEKRARLGEAARLHIVENYEARRLMRKRKELFESL